MTMKWEMNWVANFLDISQAIPDLNRSDLDSTELRYGPMM